MGILLHVHKLHKLREHYNFTEIYSRKGCSVQADDTIILLNLRSVFPDYTGNISRSKGFDSSLGTRERFGKSKEL